MDKEQQIRINFLDEAEDCFHEIESVLIDLSGKEAEPQQLDLALRAAHSVKGGAGMMGFMALSNIAHEIEDYFKILRVRHHSSKISTEVETLLLKSLDSLREVSQLHRKNVEIGDLWLAENVNPIFASLSEHLGEIQQEDENALLEQSSDEDSMLEMVEVGMESILDEFAQKLPQLPVSELADELTMTCDKLITMGRMGDLEALVELCESIQNHTSNVETDQLATLAEKSLNIWQRSQALIVRRSLEKLPNHLEMLTSQPEITATQEIETDTAFDLFADEELLAFEEVVDQELFDDHDKENLGEMSEGADQDKLVINSDKTIITNQTHQGKIETHFNYSAVNKSSQSFGQQNIRVPAEQLYQFNSLFGKLIIERNRVNLRLGQLKNFVNLMRQRMNQLERSNNQLRNWYDRASVEGIIPTTEQPLPNNEASNNNSKEILNDKYQGEFDALEMDRYSDLHLISQEQIETIVQLDEVSNDIELGLQEMTQAVQELNQTTRSLQGNVTRTQMVPFAEVVKPFPRLVRDLSVNFGKQVNLVIEGEATLLDRAIVETLNAPLMHLMRNAFDHGIEDSATRIAYQKPSQGTITIKAVNRGTQTLITISDDGGGINLEKVCDRLRQMGISNDKIRQMSESQILDYIFQPGFSTTSEVTELSGRGVGMDVVRSSIQAIRGDIEVETKAGQGTTFTLKVPYTLSILRVMLVERKGLIFALPADTVRQVLQIESETEQMNWQDQTIPLVQVENNLVFNRPRKPFEIEEAPVINQTTALIVGENNSLGGLIVDRLWNEQEVSIRPIESLVPLPQGFISSMILGDGRVVPLLDPVKVLQSCLEEGSVPSDGQNQPVNFISEKQNQILIVDDSINVRRFLALTLEKAGYQVEQAKDGQEAVDKLFSGLSPQAVICDIEMPRLDGYGVLEEVKAKPEFESLPIAMLTSRSNEKHRKVAMNLGASAYFSKPYNEQQLLETLEQLIHS